MSDRQNKYITGQDGAKRKCIEGKISSKLVKNILKRL
jgi:hypothetical protein